MNSVSVNHADKWYRGDQGSIITTYIQLVSPVHLYLITSCPTLVRLCNHWYDHTPSTNWWYRLKLYCIARNFWGIKIWQIQPKTIFVHFILVKFTIFSHFVPDYYYFNGFYFNLKKWKNSDVVVSKVSSYMILSCYWLTLYYHMFHVLWHKHIMT